MPYGLGVALKSIINLLINLKKKSIYMNKYLPKLMNKSLLMFYCSYSKYSNKIIHYLKLHSSCLKC